MPSIRQYALSVISAAVATLIMAFPVAAQEKLKIGVINQFSGPFADAGLQTKQGIETYLALHGNRVDGREIELIYRDVGGPKPAMAKQLAEELIVKDKVSMLAGFYLSPEASAAASVVTETKTPAVLMNATSAPVVGESPFFVRSSNSIWQLEPPAAEWAIKQGKKKAYIAVADYAPGWDVQEAFKTSFKGLGGDIVGEDRIPLRTVDFAPFAERIVQAKPDVLMMFVGTGAPAVGFLKALVAQGAVGKNITIIGQSEMDDPDLPKFDDSIVGVYSTITYALGLPYEENRKFKEGVKAKFGSVVPNFIMAESYDSMNLLFHMIASQQGKPFDGASAIAAARGYSWNGARGPLTIEPDTRDVTLNVYIRKVAKVDGHLENVIVETYPAVKDPWAQMQKQKK
jgi:branched-chain amino acid transport system substrate-binding protein